MAAQEVAAAPLGLPGHVVRSAGGAVAVKALLLLSGGSELVKKKATEQKADAGESCNTRSPCAPARALRRISANHAHASRPGPGEPSGFLVVPGRAECGAEAPF